MQNTFPQRDGCRKDSHYNLVVLNEDYNQAVTHENLSAGERLTGALGQISPPAQCLP